MSGRSFFVLAPLLLFAGAVSAQEQPASAPSTQPASAPASQPVSAPSSQPLPGYMGGLLSDQELEPPVPLSAEERVRPLYGEGFSLALVGSGLIPLGAPAEDEPDPIRGGARVCVDARLGGVGACVGGVFPLAGTPRLLAELELLSFVYQYVELTAAVGLPGLLSLRAAIPLDAPWMPQKLPFLGAHAVLYPVRTLSGSRLFGLGVDWAIRR